MMQNAPQLSLSRLLDVPPLIVGVGGMLYRAWAEVLNRRGITFRSPSLNELDLTKPETIDRALAEPCRLVINCAAYTDVDGAEKNEPLATAINGEGVGHLAQRCREAGAFLVHYSTDYVFNGRGSRPYRPDASREPLGAYARSKAVGEVRIQESGCDYLMVRTSWLYAPWGKNFVRTIAGLVRQKKPLRIVDDQRGRPTSGAHLACSTLALLERGARGIWHVTDGGECSWYEFAKEIGRRIDPEVPVAPCTTAELNRPAPRPAYSVLDLTRTESLLGPMPDWKAALADVLARME